MTFNFAAIRDKSRDLLNAARNRVMEVREQVRPHVDRAAEKAAKKVTDVTGRETTPDEVKKAAVIAGAIGLGVMALASAGGAASAPMALGPASGNTGFGGSGDVMDQAYGFFARNGSSLNIETHTVDMDGCILD